MFIMQGTDSKINTVYCVQINNTKVSSEAQM